MNDAPDAAAMTAATNPAAAAQPADHAAVQSPAPEQPMYALPCDSGDEPIDDDDMRLWAMLEHPSVWDD